MTFDGMELSGGGVPGVVADQPPPLIRKSLELHCSNFPKGPPPSPYIGLGGGVLFGQDLSSVYSMRSLSQPGEGLLTMGDKYDCPPPSKLNFVSMRSCDQKVEVYPPKGNKHMFNTPPVAFKIHIPDQGGQAYMYTPAVVPGVKDE